MLLYVLKIKGKAKIPDYIQIRDQDFVLKAYFRLDRPEKTFSKMGLEHLQERFFEYINPVEFGKFITIDKETL